MGILSGCSDSFSAFLSAFTLFLPGKSGYFGTLSVYQESVMKLPVSETSPKRVAMTAAATELPPPTRVRRLLWLRQRPSLLVLALAPLLLARGQGGGLHGRKQKSRTLRVAFLTPASPSACKPLPERTWLKSMPVIAES